MIDANQHVQVYMNNRRLRILLVLLCGSVLLLTLGLTYRYVNRRAELERVAFDGARVLAANAAERISSAFVGVMNIGQSLADALTSGSLAYTDVGERLQDEVAARPDIDGLAVTFAPFVYDPDLRLYQTYISKQPDGTFSTLDGATYDYTQPQGDDPNAPNTDWYRNPMANGAMWNEPFFAQGAQKVLIEYGVPFERAGERAGLVTIDYSLQDTRSLIASLELGSTGYGYVISSSGTFLAHPVDDLVGQSTIFALADSLDDSTLRSLGQRALNGERFATEVIDPMTRQTTWVFIEPIPSTGWAIGIVLNRNEFLPDARDTLREQMTIVLSSGLLVVTLSALAFRVERREPRHLWSVSIAFSVTSTVIIALTWHLAATLPQDNGLIITDTTALDRYLERYRESRPPNGELVEVPTGVFIQSLAFPNATSVVINGYLWQRFIEPLPDGLSTGFTLPQRIDTQSTLEMFNQAGDVTTWEVAVTLTQNFDPTLFPFDNRQIAIRLSAADLSGRVILTPDLEGYALLDPEVLPGLDSEVSINNWDIARSAYQLKSIAYNTTFGLPEQRASAPELYFTIDTRRQFFGSFIAYLLPGVVAAGLLFAFLLNDKGRDSQEEIVTALNYSAALFFVIAVAHNTLRDSIAAVGLTYMEYLYILLYVAIIMISINTFLYVKRPDIAFIHYSDNLFPKLIYWPIMMGVLLVATLVLFVYR